MEEIKTIPWAFHGRIGFGKMGIPSIKNSVYVDMEEWNIIFLMQYLSIVRKRKVYF